MITFKQFLADGWFSKEKKLDRKDFTDEGGPNHPRKSLLKTVDLTINSKQDLEKPKSEIDGNK